MQLCLSSSFFQEWETSDTNVHKGSMYTSNFDEDEDALTSTSTSKVLSFFHCNLLILFSFSFLLPRLHPHPSSLYFTTEFHLLPFGKSRLLYGFSTLCTFVATGPGTVSCSLICFPSQLTLLSPSHSPGSLFLNCQAIALSRDNFTPA